MALYLKRTAENFVCAVWQLTESCDELLALLPDPDFFRQEMESRFSNPKRQMEYLAVRVLLYRLTGRKPLVGYNSWGKPSLLHDSRFVSISHTQGFAAVILSSEAEVGVDIETFSERVLRVRSRIVGPAEVAGSVWEVLLHWSAKETVYKMMNCRHVDFLKHLQVLPPLSLSQDWKGDKKKSEGCFAMAVQHPDFQHICRIHYLLDPVFVLTYSILE